MGVKKLFFIEVQTHCIGVYSFAFRTYLHTDVNDIFTLIKVDGVIKAHRSIVRAAEIQFEKYYGMELTIKLEVGQKVWVEVIGNYLSHSFFTGTLLY